MGHRVPDFEKDELDKHKLESLEATIAEHDKRIEYLQKALREVQDKRTTVVKEARVIRVLLRQRVYNREYNQRSGKNRGGHSDHEYVLATDLVPHLESFIARNSDHHRGGGVRQLCMRSGVNARALWRIRKEHTKYVTFALAEELMISMGLEGLLGNEIKIYNRKEFRDFHRQSKPPVQEVREGDREG